MSNREYTTEEVLILDKKLRGRIYFNPRSKNKFFLHCVVQDLDTKEVSVVLSNIFKQAMISVKLEKFNEQITVDGKQVNRFIVEEKVETNQQSIPVKQTNVTERLHKYEQAETILNFSNKGK